MAYGMSLKTESILTIMSQIRNMMLPTNIGNLSDIIDSEQVKKIKDLCINIYLH
jgi:poly-beta-hydroxyalkanoate depolymerase